MKVTTSRGKRYVEHEEPEKFWSETRKGRTGLEDLDAEGKIMSKWI
jgi:hypothetical protein